VTSTPELPAWPRQDVLNRREGLRSRVLTPGSGCLPVAFHGSGYCIAPDAAPASGMAARLLREAGREGLQQQPAPPRAGWERGTQA